MVYEEFTKNISLKNSVNIARTLANLFSDPKSFEEFKENINKYQGNHSMQKYVWNREMDIHLRKLLQMDRELLDIQLKSMCTASNSLHVIGTIKHSYKLVNIHLHTDIPLTYEERTFVKHSRHLYVEDKKTVEIPANSDFEIHRINLMKLLLERRFFGVMANAKIKVPNNNFTHGIATPFDIFNKCIIQLDKQD